MDTKGSLSERDIITKYILPAIEASGWDKRNQIREEVSFTAGRIFVKGKLTKRGEKKRADIIIYYKSNIPVAVVETKDNKHAVGAGMQQALEYADTLDVPVAISSNGDGFVIQYRRNCGCPDASGKAVISENADLEHFPAPSELWSCYKRYNNIESKETEETSLCSYFFDAEGRTPRYYQRIAINRAVEAIARGQNRILLVMATGTGKTYTAFQIIYRLWKSGCKKRILYLADRNNLVTQIKKGDFKHFKDKCHIDERTNLVAKKIMEYLANSDPMAKTIVFCVDIEHAERMRQALLQYAPREITEKSDKYIVRITGDDPVAKGYLEDFINPEERFPVIATTSKLMSTGTDAQTCKLICLDENIGSMTEFKQIIGRGTRINEDYGKQYFTIIDFRNVTDKFADKDFDGAPVKIKESKQDDQLSEEIIDEGAGEEPIDPVTGEQVVFAEYKIDENYGLQNVAEPVENKKEKVYIAGVDVSVLSERRQFLDSNGKLITTSLKEYTKNGILTSYRSLDNFLQAWNDAEKKQAIIEELENQGLIFEELKEEIKSDLDIFDLICHIAWDAPALTRRERAENVRKRNYWTKYGDKARTVLEALLDKYAENGIENIESMRILTVDPLKELGTPAELVNAFGGKPQYLAAIRELEAEIYRAA